MNTFINSLSSLSLLSANQPDPHQQRSKTLYSRSKRVSSTTLPSLARALLGFKNDRIAGKSTCKFALSARKHTVWVHSTDLHQQGISSMKVSLT